MLWLMRHHKRLYRHERGVTALEFALLAPAFFLLLLGLIEVCLILTKIVLAENSMRISSRTAIVEATGENDIRAMIEQKTFGLVRFDNPANCVCIAAFSSIADLNAADSAGSCGACPAGNASVDDPNAFLLYQLIYTHDFITPMGGLMKLAARSNEEPLADLTFSTSTTIKNEPF